MKKAVCFLVFILVISVFSACTARPTEKAARVQLCDPDSYVIDSSVFELSEKDLRSAIAAEFSSMDIDIDPENLTDEDAALLQFGSVAELKASAIRQIVTHRLVEEVYTYIFEDSQVILNKDTDSFVSDIEEKVTAEAKQRGMTAEEFIEEKYGMQADAFRDGLCDLWVNMQICFAFCNTYAIACTDEEILDCRLLLEDSEEFQCYAANEEIETELIRFFILEEKLQSRIEDSRRQEIERYTSELFSSLA